MGATLPNPSALVLIRDTISNQAELKKGWLNLFMKKMIFVGSEKDANYIYDISERLEIELIVTGEFTHITDTVNPILAHESDIIVYDVSMFIDEASIIKDEIVKMTKLRANNLIIINAIGFNENSLLINQLISAGINHFVFDVLIGPRRDEMEKCLNGYYDKISHPIVEATINNIEKEKENIQIIEGSKHTIGVCGSQERIGVTTNAIQIVKYLLYLGYKAAYVEMNNHGFVEMCAELYADAQKRSNCITYSGIDMYVCDSPTNLNDLLKLDYDFYVYDYGYFTEQDFQTLSYCEREYKVVVAGAKPNEFGLTQQLLNTNYFNDASMVFSFIAEGDRADVSEMMMELSTNVSYIDWCPDPFSINDASIKRIEKILPIEKKPTQKKKFAFFKKR